MILHVSDFHACERWFKWLVDVSHRFELVALAGDLLDLNPHRRTADQIEMVLRHLRAIRSPRLAICSGNHDSEPGGGPRLSHARWLQELRGPHVSVDGDTFDYAGHRFTCVPWMTPVAQANQREVWLIHSPPDQTETSIVRGGADFGSFDLGELCRAGDGPRLCLSGHVHDRRSWYCRVERTSCLNPGWAEDTASPSYNVIDLGRGIASHHSASGDTDLVRV